MAEGVGKCVGVWGPNTCTFTHTSPNLPPYFPHLSLFHPHPNAYTYPHTFPHLPGSSSTPLDPNTLSHSSLQTSSHTSLHTPFLHLPLLHPNPIYFPSPILTLPHIFPHLLKVWRTYHVTKFLWRIHHVTKFLWRSYHVTKFLWRTYRVAKFLWRSFYGELTMWRSFCGELTMWRSFCGELTTWRNFCGEVFGNLLSYATEVSAW